jgi:hypothetical protein
VGNVDSLEIAESLHTFYKWYATTGEPLQTDFNFINQDGEHPVLDEAKLATYLGEFVKSGVVSTAWVADETRFYRACAELWKNEMSGEIISGMDADRFYCAQDGEFAEFQTAPVSVKVNGDQAKVELLLKTDGPNGGPRSFEMKKENNKWLLSKLGCDSGVKY